MSSKLTIQTAIDVFVTPTRKSAYGSSRLYVGTNSKSYIFFALPQLPEGAQIFSANLYAFADGDLKSMTSAWPVVSVFRLTEPFDPSNTVWTDLPTTEVAAADTANLPIVTSTGKWGFDITVEMQTAVNGTPWYGLMMTANSATDYFFKGAASGTPLQLEIVYTAPPRTPTDLLPRNGVTVAQSQPALSWNFFASAVGEKQYGFEVRVSASSLMTSTWNSGLVVSESSVLFLSQTNYPALADNASAYWQVRVRNDAGLWSAWSAVTAFTYDAPGSVAITGPAATMASPTPLITWSLTSMTQQAYQVIITGYGETYDTGVKVGSVTSYQTPQGIWDYVDDSYLVEVRVWDDVLKAATPANPLYVKATRTVKFTPGGATPPVQIQTVVNAPWPSVNVQWRYTGAAADFFRVIRYRIAGGKEYATVVGVYTPAQAKAYAPAGAEWYGIADFWVPGRSTIRWEVQTVRAGLTSTSNPTVTKKIRNAMTTVMSATAGPSVSCSLVNAKVTPGLVENSEMVNPISGLPFLVVHSQKGYAGSVSGELANDTVAGVTALDMKMSMLYLRANPRAILVWADEAIDCYVHNIDIVPIPTADGETAYAISFDFVQIGGGSVA